MFIHVHTIVIIGEFVWITIAASTRLHLRRVALHLPAYLG